MKLIILLFIFFTQCTSPSVENKTIDKCAEYNEKSAICYSNYDMNGDEQCLDSALFYIEEIINDCENYVGILSIRKLSILSVKQEYTKALQFIETFEKELFSDLPYFQNLLKNRFIAMRFQADGDITSRDMSLTQSVEEIKKYLIINNVKVDSLLKLPDIENILEDPISTALIQYYYYRSITEGIDNIEAELTNEKNDNNWNKEFCEYIIDYFSEDLMVYSGF